MSDYRNRADNGRLCSLAGVILPPDVVVRPSDFYGETWSIFDIGRTDLHTINVSGRRVK